MADRRSPGGVPVRVYEPQHPRGSTLIYLHGGGWVLGDATVATILGRLSQLLYG